MYRFSLLVNIPKNESKLHSLITVEAVEMMKPLLFTYDEKFVYLLAFPHMHANTDAHNIPCKFNSILEILIYLFIISTRLVCVSLCVVHEHIVSSCIEPLCGSIGGRV